MKSNKLFGMFFILLVLMSSLVIAGEKIHATVEPSRDYEEIDMVYLTDDEKDEVYHLSYKIGKDTEKLKIKEMNQYLNKSDFKIENYKGSYINFKRVANYSNIKNISIHSKSGFATQIAEARDVELDYATIVLAKESTSYISYISHSFDGINFTRTNIKFDQNETHVWFNTTHFSSFTGTIGDIELVEGDDEVYVDISDFATIDATDYVCLQFGDYGSYDEICNDGGYITGQATNTLNQDTYHIDLDSAGDFVLEADDHYFTDNSFNVLVKNSDGSLDTFQSLTVTVREMELPEPDIDPVTLITETTARFNGEVDFQDWDSTVTALFSYRVSGTSTWSDTASFSVSDGVAFHKDITGLTSGETYQVSLTIGFGSSTDSDGLMYFTTESEDEPTVTTMSVYGLTTTGATLRGYPLKEGFSGTVTGRFGYRETGTSTWTYTAGETITDEVSYDKALTGLTENQEYDYYATLSWTDGTAKTSNGGIVTFTPEEDSSSDLVTDLELYYSFDDDDLSGSNPLDLTSNDVDGTNDGATTGVSSVINEGFDFDGTNDFVSFSLGSLGTTYSIGFWVNLDSFGLAIGGNNADLNNFILYIADGDTISHKTGSGNDCGVTLLSTLSLNTNYYISISRDNSERIHFHINGVDNGYCDLDSNDATSLNVLARRSSGDTLYLDGTLDEFGVWSKFLSTTDFSSLYNSGSGVAYPFVTESIPESTTLTPSDINLTGANLRGIADVGDFTGNVYGTFQYKANTSSTWLNVGDTGTPISNDTIFSYGINNLTSDTDYDVKTVLTWYDGESLNSYGDIIQFTTSKIVPTITQFGDSDTTTTATNISYNLTLNDYSSVAFILSYAPYSDILSGTATYTDVIIGNKSSDGFYTEQLTNLTTGTKYGYILYYSYGEGSKSTDLQTVTVGESSIPTIYSVLTDKLTRTTGRTTINLNSMGLYSLANITLFRRETGATPFDTLESFITSSPDNLTYSHSGLTQDTPYDLLIQVNYGLSIYNTSLYYFETYATTDFVPPFLDAYTPVVYEDTAQLIAEIDLQDASSVTLVFEVLGELNSSESGFTSSGFSISENGNYTFNLTNLDKNLLYYRAKIGYNNGSEVLYLTSDYYTFTPSSAGTVLKTGSVELLPNFHVFINDPYLFSLLVLMGIIVIGLSFGIVLGQTEGVMRDNAPKFLIYVVLGVEFIAIIFLRLNNLIPLWQLIISITGLVIMSIFYLVNNGVNSYG